MKLADVPKCPLLFVVGSTASGKSELALQLAEKYQGIIVNCDSVQFYDKLKIGSASPSVQDLSRVPHYLYNYVSCPQEMTAGQFLRDFYQLLKKENFKKPIFVVGGTGFYIQALEKGMYNIPEVSDEIKKQVLSDIETQGAPKMFQELIDFDPHTLIHPNDAYRIGRALEVKRQFGKKMSELIKEAEQNTKNGWPYPMIKLGLMPEKTVLRQRIEQRTALMLKMGMIDEVREWVGGEYENWAPLNSVGYYEVKQFLNGQLSMAELEAAINLSTSQLVKKQRTWFKRDATILWSESIQKINSNLIFQIDQFLQQFEC